MPKPGKRPWRELERLVELLERVLDRSATVEHDVRIPDLNTGTLRQFDVLVRSGGPRPMLVVVEVQKRGKKVGIDQMEQWVAKARAVGANRLMCVSEAGYTDTAAVDIARKYGPFVLPFTLKEVEGGEEWARLLAKGFLVERHWYRFRPGQEAVVHLVGEPGQFGDRGMETKWVRRDGEPLDFYQYLAEQLKKKVDSEPESVWGAVARVREIAQSADAVAVLEFTIGEPGLEVHWPDGTTARVSGIGTTVLAGCRTIVANFDILKYEKETEGYPQALLAVANWDEDGEPKHIRMVFELDSEGLHYRAASRNVENIGGMLVLDGVEVERWAPVPVVVEDSG